MKEYRVYEKSHTDEDMWYSHGQIHTNKFNAIKDLNEMRDYYGKYGRVFKLFSREITNWEPDELNNLPFNYIGA